MNAFKKISLICMPCFLFACSTVPQSGSNTKGAKQPQIMHKQIQVTTVDPVVKGSGVVNALLDQALQQVKNGEQQAAESSLERAIRIAPRFPESYFRLAELRYQQGKYSQARSLAQKALSLGADGSIRRQALSLVDRASAAQP